MGKTNREEAKAAEGQEALKYPILALPGVIGNRYWSELAEEAQTYLELLRKLERTATDAVEREALEDEMIASLSHLAMHSSVLYDSVDEAIENSDEDEDGGLPQTSTSTVAPMSTPKASQSSKDEMVEEAVSPRRLSDTILDS